MHEPVLLQESIDNLFTFPQGTYIDCTLGGGGHSSLLLEKLNENGKIIAFDKDLDILEETKRKVNSSKMVFCHADFKNIESELNNIEINEVDGILMDLGVSSFQLDRADRGFSFRENAPLDMRMDRTQQLSAFDIINYYSQEEISDILFKYGEEKYAKSIAKRIVESRAEKNIDTTLDLVEIIKNSVPSSYKRDKHPARKTFQAIRIVVNNEMGSLQDTLPQAVNLLKKGGRLCVITFHSLEDRIVKQFMQMEAKDCICPPKMPICICEKEAKLKIISRKPIIPSIQESANNLRARSAKLRVAEKL